MSTLFNGIRIYTDPYLGELVVPQPPLMKRGPYLQRRMKRWRRAHPPYRRGKGEYFILQSHGLPEAIVCHPDDLAVIREQIAKMYTAVRV